jgi:hypothetical protein
MRRRTSTCTRRRCPSAIQSEFNTVATYSAEGGIGFVFRETVRRVAMDDVYDPEEETTHGGCGIVDTRTMTQDCQDYLGYKLIYIAA